MRNQPPSDTKHNPNTSQEASEIANTFLASFDDTAPVLFKKMAPKIAEIQEQLPAIIQTLIDQDRALAANLSAVLNSVGDTADSDGMNSPTTSDQKQTLEQKTNHNPLQLITEYAGLPRLEQKIEAALKALRWIKSIRGMAYEWRTPTLTLTQIQLLLGILPEGLNLSEAIPNDSWQSTPLHYLAIAGFLHMGDLSDTVSCKNKYNETPLHWAAFSGHIDIVRALIAAGADLNIKSNKGYTALVCAAEKGHTESVRALIDAGADLNIRNYDGNTALILAAYNGHTESVRALITAVADLNIQGYNRNTALMLAALKVHTESVRALIAAGADLNIKNNYGYTALILAVSKGHTESVPTLIAAGADLNITDEYGYTALDLARLRGRTAAIKTIIEADTTYNGAVHRSDSKVIPREDLDAAQKAHLGLVSLMAATNFVRPALDRHLFPALANIVAQYYCVTDFLREPVRPRTWFFTADSKLRTYAQQREEILDPQTNAQRALLQDIRNRHLMITPALLSFLSEAIDSADPAAFSAQNVARIDFLMKTLICLSSDKKQTVTAEQTKYALDQINAYAGAWFSQTVGLVMDEGAKSEISALITPGASSEELQQAADQICA